MNPHQLVATVNEHFDATGRKWPTTSDALKFLTTEIGEAMEQTLAGKGYVRNNPEDKPDEFNPDAFAEELGDVIYMAIITGIVEGVDPVRALLAKIERHHDALDPVPF